MIFSLILPVYNVEKYIERCIESCCNQKNFDARDYEIIIVDDSTPDNSIVLVLKVLKKYPEINVKIISRPNGGLSAARNTGLQNAVGDYIWFIDSDDYIEKNSLSTLHKVITEHSGIEVITFGYRNVYSKLSIDCHPPHALFNRMSSGCDLIANTAFYAAWNRIYNKKFLLDSGIKFVEGIIWEDGEFNLRLLSRTYAHYCIPNILYNYVRRPASISTSNKIYLTLNSDLYKFDSLHQWIKQHNDFSDHEIRILNKRNNESIIFMLAGLRELPKNERDTYYKEIRKRRRIIKNSFFNSVSRLHKFLGLCVLCFPQATALILGYKMNKILTKEKVLFQ